MPTSDSTSAVHGEHADQHAEIARRRQRVGDQLVARGDVGERQAGIELLHRLAQRRARARAGSPAVRTTKNALRQIDEREIDRAVRLGRVEAGPAHVADDADDGRPRTGRAAAACGSGGRSTSSPGKNRFAQARSTTTTSSRSECSSSSRPRSSVTPGGLEEAGRHADPGADRLVLAGRRRAILEIEVVRSGRSRSAAGCRTSADALDARQRAPAARRRASRTPRGRRPADSARAAATRDAVSMRVVSMPTGTWLSRSRLARTSTPATSSGVASANSAATSARWTRRGVGPSVDDRPPARSA